LKFRENNFNNRTRDDTLLSGIFIGPKTDFLLYETDFMNFTPLLFIIVMTLTNATFANASAKKDLPLCPESPNCVSSQAQDAGHYIAPFKIIGDSEKAWAALKNAILGKGRMVITRETPDSIDAEATSLVFRFVDDINAILDADALLIHIRSASRTGYSDFGVNRKRIEALRLQLQKANVIK
jgi:uncharacterized protein (DUF1499 family)